MSKRTTPASVNEGIQANTVKADVLAVGRNARATKQVWSRTDLKALQNVMRELRHGIDVLRLPPERQKAVAVELDALDHIAKSPSPDADQAERSLSSLARKLKAAGIVLAETVALSEPIGKISALLRLAATHFWR